MERINVNQLSWDEIEALHKELYEQYEPIKETDCNHQWVEYVGLVQVYEYCSKCDEKREINNG